MNMAITDGLALMPPFAAGLSQWSSGDGTPGSDTYAGSGGGVYVPADADFAGCMEIVKSASTQKVRWTGQTPILPGLYLRVTARVKAVAGALPAVRIAGFPATSSGAAVSGVTTAGPSTQLTAYGQVVTISAIIGPGLRTGVNMFWPGVSYGHLGLDLTGPTGGVVRIDDLQIEDITSVFLRQMLAQVDVRDYGARGDGVTNDAPAFTAADSAAQGREVLVPAGTYFLNSDVTFRSPVRFEGRVTMPADKRLILQGNFDFNSYLGAFGEEEMAFRKGFQALLNFADHEGFDLCGRRISLSKPMNMQAADPTRPTFAQRRVIRNGQFQPGEGSDFADTVVTSQATYSASSPTTLTGVANIANIAVGSLVTGPGVGREVYVREVSVEQARLTLSAELFDAVGTQEFTFRRFKYLLDFSGYADLAQFVLSDVDLYCDGKASGILLPQQGVSFHVRDCFFTKPKDRGISSIGSGCQGLMIDRCQFLSNEQSLAVQDRTTIAFNANANDIKVRDNRVVKFKHFGVVGGAGSIISGNHWFQGDEIPDGVRRGGIVFTYPNIRTLVTGNYIDNNFIEWTNEHDATPTHDSQYSFGGLTVTGNTFMAIDVAPWFNWIVIKPYGSGHFINGLTVCNNVFRANEGNIDRIEGVDTTYADLDMSRASNVTFAGNVFHGVNQQIRNPLSMSHVQSSASRTWTCDTTTWLPFKGRARIVEAVTPVRAITDGAGAALYEQPYVEPEQGDAKRQFRLVWKTSCKGEVRALVRMDNPQ